MLVRCISAVFIYFIISPVIWPVIAGFTSFQHANFEIFQVGGNGPAIICTLNTGNCIGAGGGSALFTAATCNGVTDDSAAFASFNSFIVGTWQVSHTGQVALAWPANATCFIGTGGTGTCNVTFDNNPKCPFANIKNILVQGNNGTLNIADTQLSTWNGLGIIQNNTQSARTASVNKGDTCASLITPSQASIFSVGQPVMMAGFDVQGLTGTPFGFPPNAQFWDHTHVASVDTVHQCNGTTSGASIHLTDALSYQYLSTWPSYNSGSSFEVDNGGPATLYAMASTWDAIIEIDALTINYSGQVQSTNDTIIYNGVTFTNNCAIPSQNRLFKAVNTNFGSCDMESDKLSDTMITQNITSTFKFFFQSPSPKLWQDTGSTFSQISGGPLVFSGNGTTVSSHIQPGAVGFGRSNSFSCTNCNIGGLLTGGYTDNGLGHGVQNTYTMSGGVINIPNGTRFSSVQSNGGLAQLVVTNSGGWTTGQFTQVKGSVYNGVFQVTVNDPTHITLQGSTFTTTDAGFVCSTGSSGSPNCAPEWGAPGTNIILSGTNGVEAIGQVTAVTQDATTVHIATTFAGGFPSDVTQINPHPSPIFNCSGCTGAAIIASLAQAPANAPLYSFQTYTFPGSNGTTVQPVFVQWGALSQLEFNVTVASSTGTPQFHLSQFDNWPVYVSGATSTYGPVVAAATAGDRKINSSGAVTCNGSAGACVGDSLTTPSGLFFGGQSNSGPQFSVAPSAGTSITVTLQTNQGVVNPP